MEKFEHIHKQCLAILEEGRTANELHSFNFSMVTAACLILLADKQYYSLYNIFDLSETDAIPLRVKLKVVYIYLLKCLVQNEHFDQNPKIEYNYYRYFDKHGNCTDSLVVEVLDNFHAEIGRFIELRELHEKTTS